jgi:anti-sigma-K factor RskA
MTDVDDDRLTPEEERSLLAAEYVLRLQSNSERRAVEQRLAREPFLADDIAGWEERLGDLVNELEPAMPPRGMWTRIHAAIAPSQRDSLWGSVYFWRPFAIGAAGLATASIAALTYIELPSLQRAPLLATLGQPSGQPGFVAAVSARGDSLTIVPAALLAQDQRALELWVIPADGRPRSLGLVQPGQPVQIELPRELAGQVTRDATLAVSVEPPGGSPTGQPTGPVIASGKLTSL